MHDTIRRVTCAIIATAAARGAAAPEPFAVELTVRESAGVARTAEPVSGGVPLPPGRFAKDQAFALRDAAGRDLPCQVRPLVVRRDGTLRWVLLDFQSDVPPDGTARYTLHAAAPTAAPKRKLAVTESDAGVVIDTGTVRLKLSRTRPFGLFESVEAGGRQVVRGGRMSYVQLHGRTGWADKSRWKRRELAAGPPERMVLHHAGPLRVTVEVAGRFADDPAGATYKAYVTAWAGSSRVHVKTKLCNSCETQFRLLPLERSRIELDLAGAAGRTLLGASEPVDAGGAGWLHQGLAPKAGEGAARAGRGEKELWRSGKEGRGGGWIARAAGDGCVFVCDRLFAPDPPRRLAADGERLLLESVSTPYEPPKNKWNKPVGAPFLSDARWLFDCTHHSSEYTFDFAAPTDADALAAAAKASRDRLWVLASPAYYSRVEAVGSGRFGTLADEVASYRTWRWSFRKDQLPRSRPEGDAFVAWEDNHYESEADTVEALLLMYLRTGDRGWFDRGEAWARYHVDLQIWRTDGWRWDDGAIWFPSGGPQGTRRSRKTCAFDWGPPWGKRKGNLDCEDLWRHARAKACYCHYYGAGVVDWYCLTGDPDALDAALDNVEVKDSEFRKHHRFEPGKTAVGSIRGFGRGFQVICRTLEARPGDATVRDLADLCARTLWQSPLLDERGFHRVSVGAGTHGLKVKDIPAGARKVMKDRGITFTAEGGRVDTLKAGDLAEPWPIVQYGGTWQHVYVQNGAERYFRLTGDENMHDFTIAFARMSAKYMRSRKCHQTWYYTHFDFPTRGQVYDPWVFEHAATEDGVGCVHSGYYTRAYPDACAKGYSLTGEPHLLAEARRFWSYGSRRLYRKKTYTCPADEVGMFASHDPPKNDQVLATARLFHEAANPRSDARAPAAVKDLAVRVLGGGKAEMRFTAPADAGGGRVARYQVKAAMLPIASYDRWDPAEDAGKRRNWWRAGNCAGEPAPSPAGSAERFVVTGVPEGGKLFFAVRSYDAASNRSGISNVAAP